LITNNPGWWLETYKWLESFGDVTAVALEDYGLVHSRRRLVRRWYRSWVLHHHKRVASKGRPSRRRTCVEVSGKGKNDACRPRSVNPSHFRAAACRRATTLA